MKLISKKEELRTAVEVGSRVTFIGELLGGERDNYSGWSKMGSMFGTVSKVNKTTIDIDVKDRGVFRVESKKVTNIDDLF